MHLPRVLPSFATSRFGIEPAVNRLKEVQLGTLLVKITYIPQRHKVALLLKRMRFTALGGTNSCGSRYQREVSKSLREVAQLLPVQTKLFAK